MTVTNLTRNLRDGVHTINDGGARTATLLLDEGDLNFDITEETIEVKDRGALHHTRPGDEMSTGLSFTQKWTQLIAESENSSDGSTLYEFLNNISSPSYTSTSGVGEKFTLEHVFTCTDPAGNNTETITFAKVYMESMNLNEDGDYNKISFSGRNFETRPTIARV